MASSVLVPSTVRSRGPARLSGTILVVDDEEGIRSLFLEMFRGERVNVRLAASGQDALAMVKQAAPALVIIDVSLPDQDGITVLDQALRIDSRMIGIVMTGAATVELAVRAMKAGASDVLMKPIRIDEVVTTVHRLLEVHRMQTESHVVKHTAVRSGAVRLHSVPFQPFGDDGTQRAGDAESEYQQGVADGLRQAEEQRRHDLQVLTDAVRKFDTMRVALQQTVEEEVIVLALEVASKVLHNSAESCREQIILQAKTAIETIRDPGTAVVHVHPADAHVLEAARVEIAGLREIALTIKIQPVASLPRGSCLVHTATRLIDASLDTQLLRLGKALQNRSSRES